MKTVKFRVYYDGKYWIAEGVDMIHNITVPYYDEIAKETLNAILNDVSKWNNIPKEELIKD